MIYPYSSFSFTSFVPIIYVPNYKLLNNFKLVSVAINCTRQQLRGNLNAWYMKEITITYNMTAKNEKDMVDRDINI